ncbi:MAG: thiamine pyrophosphate-binding protein [bacterium]
MIRVSDYLAKRLVDYGVKHVFMLPGGGAMYLNDSLGHEKGLCVISNHHEQACAMAAEGYSRVSGKIGVVNVTTGPGGINALNGVFGAWTDSIPMLIISGQVKRETCMGFNHVPSLRQLGDQEGDIISMAKVITKYAVLVRDPETIRYHLEKAIHMATTGRPGPVWIDIPLDIQSSLIDEEKLIGYNLKENDNEYDRSILVEQCREVLTRIQKSSRPVILAGTGVRLANALDIFDKVIHKLRIPVTTAWTHDIIASDDPLFCGRPGTIGTRAGNFTVQNADLLLIIGSRLNIRQVSYNWQSFARYAYKIWVDIDPAELNKPTVKPDFAIQADARIFLEELDRQIEKNSYDPSKFESWLSWCRERMVLYPPVLSKHRVFNGKINPYHFIEVLFNNLSNDDVVVCGNATACIVAFQTAFLKKGQRLFSNSGAASMGYDLPAAIGAAVAREGKRVICLAGDGSIQLYIQELQTVVHYGLPIKIFVLNNDGYLSIRSTQSTFFGRIVGESPNSGVTFPDMTRIANAYGIPALKIDKPNFANEIKKILNTPGPSLGEVMLDPQQLFEPRMSSKQLPDGRIVSPSLEDMFPFLPREELEKNCLFPKSDSI